jgi:glutamyl/glutaminyl-tRNA synthetase
MNVTHIMRGQEFISSTPKFLSLYEALGVTPPQFVTLPPILGEGGTKKLGKRDGAKDVLEYRTEGYLPEAMLNFLALLGWNPGGEQEVFTAQEIIDLFDVARVQKSGAQWNDEKLNWLNREHIKRLPLSDQERWVAQFIPERIKSLSNFSQEMLKKITPIATERIEKFDDIRTMAADGEFDYYFQAPVYDPAKLVWKTDTEENTKTHLLKALELLKTLPESDFTRDSTKTAVWEYAESVGRGNVLWPLRYALSGREKSPDPFVLSEVLGKAETLVRIEGAAKSLA